MFLEPAKFNTWLRKIGQDVCWRRAHDCPCRDPNSGAPSPDCRVCRNGRVWVPSVAGYLGMAGQKVNRAWEQSGQWENGDVVCSLPSDTPLYKMGEYDRVVFHQSSVPFSLVRVKVAAPDTTPTTDDVVMSDNLLLLPDGSPDPTAPSLEFDLECIDRVFWLNDDRTAVVEGGIPTLSRDGSLKWRTGAPPTGRQYTISGRKRPEYFCFKEYPQDRAHHGGRSLPRRVVLRLFDLYGRAA